VQNAHVTGREDEASRRPEDPTGSKEPPDEMVVPLTQSDQHFERLGAVLGRLERLIDPELQRLCEAETELIVPAWRRVTQREPRLPVSLAVIVAISLQLALPDRFAAQPRWPLPALALLLLIALVTANPKRLDRPSLRLRTASMILIAVLSVANAWSAARLITSLIQGTSREDAGPLLAIGAAIWLTNVIVFALWYWELDRGGPAARAQAARLYPDFLFVQMQSPELAPADWEPRFADYLYLSFTNATAFSPTDVLPLSRWAKLTMMLQSAVSLTTVALVIARAVNILK
jgi:uncharacterized membrane protein